MDTLNPSIIFFMLIYKVPLHDVKSSVWRHMSETSITSTFLQKIINTNSFVHALLQVFLNTCPITVNAYLFLLSLSKVLQNHKLRLEYLCM